MKESLSGGCVGDAVEKGGNGENVRILRGKGFEVGIGEGVGGERKWAHR